MAYILTAKEVSAMAAERWKRKYERMFHLKTHINPNKTWGKIYEEIKDESDPAKINAAIGNESWTTVSCSECGKHVDAVAVFDVNGGEYDHYLCNSCCMDIWK